MYILHATLISEIQVNITNIGLTKLILFLLALFHGSHFGSQISITFNGVKVGEVYFRIRLDHRLYNSLNLGKWCDIYVKGA